MVLQPRPILVWNASPSSPRGLYFISSPEGAKTGDHLVAWAPHWARALGATRHYIPYNVPLVKKLAAVEGDQICSAGGVIIIRGRAAATKRVADPAGRPMPSWNGCRRLKPKEYFLFDPQNPDAFDGRYFGTVTGAQLVGKARLIWRA